MDFEFAHSTFLVKKFAQAQAILDKEFANEILDLTHQIFLHKITGLQFWGQYKKILLKSASKNKKTMLQLLGKIDKQMQAKFKEVEKRGKEGKQGTPLPDLSLPE